MARLAARPEAKARAATLLSELSFLDEGAALFAAAPRTKNVVLEKSYKEYMEGFTDVATGEARRGFMEVVEELETRFPDPASIEKEADKKAFVKLFGEYLQIENVLQNYDEFARDNTVA
jgi:type I site-specific restriction-modification system R (restriction) subunit